MFTRRYRDVFAGDDRWRSLPTPEGDVFDWDPQSTYVRKPPYFDGMDRHPAPSRISLGRASSLSSVIRSPPITSLRRLYQG